MHLSVEENVLIIQYKRQGHTMAPKTQGKRLGSIIVHMFDKARHPSVYPINGSWLLNMGKYGRAPPAPD